jgi:hypothetical protein
MPYHYVMKIAISEPHKLFSLEALTPHSYDLYIKIYLYNNNNNNCKNPTQSCHLSIWKLLALRYSHTRKEVISQLEPVDSYCVKCLYNLVHIHTSYDILHL